jgi:hypothetical protein
MRDVDFHEWIAARDHIFASDPTDPWGYQHDAKYAAVEEAYRARLAAMDHVADAGKKGEA